MAKFTKPKRRFSKFKISPKYKLPEDADIDYKNVTLIQRYVSDRGKIVPRRVSGISAKNQRLMSQAIKRARFLALLPSGSVD